MVEVCLKIAHNVLGVYEVGVFKAQMFVPPQNFNRSTRAECLIVSPNFINTLLAVCYGEIRINF